MAGGTDGIRHEAPHHNVSDHDTVPPITETASQEIDRRRRQMSFEDPSFDPIVYINDRFPDGTIVVSALCLGPRRWFGWCVFLVNRWCQRRDP